MSFVLAGIVAAFVSVVVMGVIAASLGVILKDVVNPFTWLYSWLFSVIGIFLAYIIALLALACFEGC